MSRSFEEAYEATLSQLEERLDACPADIDYDISSDILTITLADGSKLIVNRQAATRQLWLAARSGGFHYDYDAVRGTWHNDRDGSEFFTELSRLASAQAGEEIDLVTPA